MKSAIRVHPLLAVAFVLATAALGWAKCGDGPGDAAAVAAARVQVTANCGCTGVPKHGTYVTCAVGIARRRVEAGTLPRQCLSVVKGCAAHSTCGRPGFVTCCIADANATRCKLKRDEARCTAKGGIPGNCPSCCDACAPGGCSGVRTSAATPGAP